MNKANTEMKRGEQYEHKGKLSNQREEELGEQDKELDKMNKEKNKNKRTITR